MSDQSPAPATDKPEPWAPPDGDQEFKFDDPESIPGWIDPSFRGYDRGPALQLPVGDAVFGEGPYTTMVARVGDTVKWVAATPSKTGHFVVIEGEPVGELATKKPVAATNASLEDMLKTGVMTPDELGPDAKAQVLGRSPRLKGLIEEGKAAPEPVAVTDLVKTS